MILLLLILKLYEYDIFLIINFTVPLDFHPTLTVYNHSYDLLYIKPVIRNLRGSIMVTIKVRFNSNMKGKLPMGAFDALRNEITKRLSPKYLELNIDINWGSQVVVSIDGLGKNEKKTYIEETLEEIWNDGEWMPEMNEREEVEYFDK